MIKLKAILHEINSTTPIDAVDPDIPFIVEKKNGGVMLKTYTGESVDVIIPSELEGLPVIEIGPGAFQFSKTKIQKVTIPDTVITIGFGAFRNCFNLTTIIFGKNVKYIGEHAFETCVKLNNIILPDSVLSIESEAFRGCRQFTTINIPSNVNKLGEIVFYECTNLTQITVDKHNTTFTAQDSVLFNKNKTILIQYPQEKRNSTYIIPEGVVTIGEGAFHKCDEYLDAITLPASLKTIEDSAFEGCLFVSEFIIPPNVISIGHAAFMSCGITSITIPDSVKKIERMAFWLCQFLKTASIPRHLKIDDTIFPEQCKIIRR